MLISLEMKNHLNTFHCKIRKFGIICKGLNLGKNSVGGNFQECNYPGENSPDGNYPGGNSLQVERQLFQTRIHNANANQELQTNYKVQALKKSSKIVINTQIHSRYSSHTRAYSQTKSKLKCFVNSDHEKQKNIYSTTVNAKDTNNKQNLQSFTKYLGLSLAFM